MDRVAATYVITLAERRPGRRRDPARLIDAAARDRDRVAVEALGERRYWGLMRIADAMLGNSSSGLDRGARGRSAGSECRRPPGRPRARGERHRRRRPTPRAIADALRSALDPAIRDAASVPRIRRSSMAGSGERVASIIGAWQPSRPPRKLPIT